MPRRSTNMIEIAGRSFRSLVGSDVQRDGMFLKVADENDSTVVAEAFYSDMDHRFTLAALRADLPLELAECIVATARIRLSPGEKGS